MTQPMHGEKAEMSSLIAIHGLNGDPINTWTHKKTAVMWLRDVLPEVLPRSRIMTYEYNANFKNFTSRQDLHSIAVKLLVDLSDCRRSEKVGWDPDSICMTYFDANSQKGGITTHHFGVSQPRWDSCQKGRTLFVQILLWSNQCQALTIGCSHEEVRVQQAVYGILFLGLAR